MELTPSHIEMHRAAHAPTTVDPSEYDELGRDAAKLAVEASMLLGDAVFEVLKDKTHYNAIQIGNVCWVANNECFRKIAEQFQAAGSPHLLFEYALADPTDVIKRLDKTKEPPMKRDDHPEYSLTPREVLGGPDTQGQADDVLKKAFKVASADLQEPPQYIQDPTKPLRVMSEQLEQIAQSSALKLSSLQHDYEDTFAYLVKSVKQAALRSEPMEDVVRLWSMVDTPERAQEVFAKVAQVLCKDYETARYLESSSKLASQAVGLPNLEHPLAEKFAHYLALEDEIKLQSRVRKIAMRDFEIVSSKQRELASKLMKRRQEA